LPTLAYGFRRRPASHAFTVPVVREIAPQAQTAVDAAW
jgi:hypothetical protein